MRASGLRKASCRDSRGIVPRRFVALVPIPERKESGPGLRQALAPVLAPGPALGVLQGPILRPGHRSVYSNGGGLPTVASRAALRRAFLLSRASASLHSAGGDDSPLAAGQLVRRRDVAM